jgi:hypothetical protein
MLTRCFGVTVHEVTTIAVIFRGGLAIGSLLAGDLPRKRSPLRVYGVIELLIALSAPLMLVMPECPCGGGPPFRRASMTAGRFKLPEATRAKSAEEQLSPCRHERPSPESGSRGELLRERAGPGDNRR